MVDLREPINNLYIASSTEDRPARLPSTTTTANESLISYERWAIAEEATCQIICKVLPTDVSGKTRNKIIGYIHRLIKTRTGCEIFPYGSVPLKTYLPDGDIDLTAFGGTFSEDFLAEEIVSLLERDGRNEDTEFVVKDVQLVRAEVKIVKCIVQNVVVDISLNQIGGLCTLCFLEQVDRLIGKDHLFKRSILLIKTWCYYESRILGALHGLISTYALETLILYIFNLFHSSLEGPLAVLHKFLDHFSKFDWETYAISINGPVRLISLPELTAELPENGGVDLLLSAEFLRNCMEMYSLPTRGGDLNSRAFQQKHLNIIDPLKENNNLGRSVSKGNFYRIRSAFSLGARNLDSILMQQDYDLNEELKKFFPNTMERHGGYGSRPVVHGPQMLHPETDPSLLKISVPESSSNFYIGTLDTCSSIQSESSTDGINEESASTVVNGHHNGSDQECQRESNRLSGNVVNHRMRVSGDANDHSTLVSESRKTSKPDANGLKNDGVTMSLTGDYETYLQCLQYVRLCFGISSGASTMFVASPSSRSPPPPPPRSPPPPPPGLFQLNNPWAAHRSSPFNMNGFSHGVIPASPFYPMNPRLRPGMHFGSEDIQKPRGTGTYHPNPLLQNRVGQMSNRPPTPKERYITSPRTPGTSRGGMFIETNNIFEHNNRKQSQSAEVVEQLGRVMIGPLNNPQSFSPRGHGPLKSNGFAVHSEGSLDFVSKEAPGLERNRLQQQKYLSVVIPKASPVSPKAVDNDDDDRVSKKSSSYHLKDVDDFPPLS